MTWINKNRKCYNCQQMAEANKSTTTKKGSGAGKSKVKMGRPSSYTQDIADEICAGLAIGQSIRTVLIPDHLPSVATFFRWLRERDDLREQYTRAKQESADAMAEDILDIADDGTNDYMTIEKDGYEREVLNHEALQRSRLRVDTRKFLMAKMKPKVYGDKLDVTTDGKELPAPIFGGASVKPVSDEDKS